MTQDDSIQAISATCQGRRLTGAHSVKKEVAMELS